jgi:hypothetical protein
MGDLSSGIFDAIANNPLNLQRSIDQHNMTQAQLPGVQAQGQQEQLKAQQMQIQMRDQQAMNDAFRQVYGQPSDQFNQKYGASAPVGPNGQRPDPMDDVSSIAMRNGMTLSGYMSMRNDHMAYQNNAATLDEKQQKALDEHNAKGGAALEGWSNLPADQQTPENWKSTYTALNGLGLANGFDPNTPPPPTQISQTMGNLNYLGTLNQHAKDKAAALESAANTASKNQATMAAQRQQAIQDLNGTVTDEASYDAWKQRNPAVAQTMPPTYDPQKIAALNRSMVPPKDQPKYDLDQQFLQNSNPQSRHAAVDAVATDPKIRQMVYGVVDAARTDEAYQAGLKLAAEKQAALDLETNPQIQQGRINVSAAEGRAHAQTQQQMQDTEQAKRDYIASKGDLSVSQAQGDEVIRLAKAAAQGDKVSAQRLQSALVQYANGLYGVKRTPNGQLAEPPGSWADKIQGWANGAQNGVPFSADILAQIPDTVQAMKQTAVQIHNARTGTTNSVRGTNFPLEPTGVTNSQDKSPSRTVPPAVKSLLSDPSVAVGTHKLSDGSSWYKAADGTITQK